MSFCFFFYFQSIIKWDHMLSASQSVGFCYEPHTHTQKTRSLPLCADGKLSYRKKIDHQRGSNAHFLTEISINRCALPPQLASSLICNCKSEKSKFSNRVLNTEVLGRCLFSSLTAFPLMFSSLRVRSCRTASRKRSESESNQQFLSTIDRQMMPENH